MARTVAGTTPYAWPWDGSIDPARTALVAVTPRAGAGQGRGYAGDPAWVTAMELAQSVRRAGGIVVQVTTTPPARPARPTHPLPVPALEADHRVEAFGVDGFYGSVLDGLLRRLGRDQLLLVGRWLETGVHSTMRSANDRGYECLLVLDACTSYDLGLRAAARSQIEMSGGIFGAVGEADDVRAALLTERTSA